MSLRSRRPVIIDTGPLVALIDHGDQHHALCVAWLSRALRERRTLVIPVPIISEICYLLSKIAGAEFEARFLDEIARSPGTFRLFHPGRQTLGRMAQLVRKYSDLPLGAADASVVAAAEFFDTAEIATVDKRLVAVVRLNDADPIHSAF